MLCNARAALVDEASVQLLDPPPLDVLRRRLDSLVAARSLRGLTPQEDVEYATLVATETRLLREL
jgi:hypothetical protein